VVPLSLLEFETLRAMTSTESLRFERGHWFVRDTIELGGEYLALLDLIRCYHLSEQDFHYLQNLSNITR
jgi:hypothetical protein